jgi:hypothetical protein
MVVADQMMNMLGQGVDGTVNHDLVLHVYAHNAQTGDFTLIADDGETIAYQDGAVQDTPITYTQQDNGWLVEIAPANGTYPNAPQQRTIEIRLITPDAQIESVEINGEILSESDWSQDEVIGAFITSAILEDSSGSLQVLFRLQD